MKVFAFWFFCFAAMVFNTESKLVLLMGENFEDCTEGGAKFFDYSGLEFEYENDTSYYLTGRTL
jgi:hypothetical protein